MTEGTPPPVDYGRSNAYGLPRPARAGNGAAVASLVLGIVGCVPFITSLLAVIFGIVGIRKTRNPAIGGKGLAIAGLVLGIVGLAGWGFFGGVLGIAYVKSGPARVVARQFLTDLTTGNISNASANSSGFTSAELTSYSQKAGAWGPLQSVTFSSYNVNWVNGQTNVELKGVANYSTGTHPCTFQLAGTGGKFKVTAFAVY